MRNLHQSEIWPSDGITCISYKIAWLSHFIATLPWIALLTLSVCIELVSSSARVTSVNSAKGVGRSDGHPDPKIGPQVYLGPIKMASEMLEALWIFSMAEVLV